MARRPIVLTLGLLVVLARPASAQSSGGAVVTGLVGVAAARNSTSLNASGSVGYRFNRVFGFELEVAMIDRLESDTGYHDALFSRLDRPGTRVTLFTNNVRLEIPTTSSRVIPYVVAGGGLASIRDRYSVIYARSDGRWLHARIRDESPSRSAPHERLKELEWMLGEWVNESDDANVFTTCKWSNDGNFLLRDFDVKIEGQVALSGTQRIGWDPQAKQIRSWIFDTASGFGGAMWTPVADAWVCKVTGVQSDGTSASATRTLVRQGQDRVIWHATDRLDGNEQLPDLSVTMVHKPPQAQ